MLRIATPGAPPGTPPEMLWGGVSAARPSSPWRADPNHEDHTEHERGATLDLAARGLRSEDAIVIAALVRHHSRLTRLTLAGNHIGADGAAALVDALCAQPHGDTGGGGGGGGGGGRLRVLDLRDQARPLDGSIKARLRELVRARGAAAAGGGGAGRASPMEALRFGDGTPLPERQVWL